MKIKAKSLAGSNRTGSKISEVSSPVVSLPEKLPYHTYVVLSLFIPFVMTAIAEVTIRFFPEVIVLPPCVMMKFHAHIFNSK